MKKCTLCGCHMNDSHESDVCECCRDEFIESNLEV